MSARRPFEPGAVEAFEFSGWELDRSDACVRLHYRFRPGPEFVETIRFPGAIRCPGETALEPRLRLLHLLAGVSYYKAACPPRLEVPYPVPPGLLAWVREVYLRGLGEFSVAHRMALGARLRFSAPAGEAVRPLGEEAAGVVVPLGGGKDSLVSVDLLERAGRDFRLLSVGGAPVVRAVAERAGRELLVIDRTLAPELLELNRRGALNGHVPISAILAGVMILAAPWYGFGTIVMSNERSAEAGNRMGPDGFEVNHQYSKTLAFERSLQAVLPEVAPGLRYFSLLRPWSELAIARRFARLTQFHDVFSSCNANFRQCASAGVRWCGSCPKCRFVYLVLAPFLPRRALREIFDGDLLADAGQIEGYRELLGLAGSKPFECVGEIDESRAALAELAGRAGWQDAAVVRALADMLGPSRLETWLQPGPAHAIPREFQPVADALG